MLITTIAPGIAGNDHLVAAKTIEEAEDCFVDAKERLLDVNNWSRYSNLQGLTFGLADGHGKQVRRRAHKGDHIQIAAPGAGRQCAVIEAIEYDDYPDLGMETFTLRMHICDHDGTEDASEMPFAAIIIERRHRQVYTAFQVRKTHMGNEENGDFGGLEERHWDDMTGRFAA